VIALVALAAATPVTAWDLESDDGGFVEDGELRQWAWGAVTNGPGAGFDGARAWGTGLTRDYLNDSTDTLEIPLPDLGDVTRPVLRFRHWYETGAGDLAWIEVAADEVNGFRTVSPVYGYPTPDGFTGASGAWEDVLVDLRGYGDTPRLRLVFYADRSGVGAGWFVDDVELHDGDIAPPRLSDLTALDDTDDLAGPYVVEVRAEDDVGVHGATLWYTVDGVETPVDMTEAGGGRWRGEIPGQPVDTEVGYRVSSTDGTNTSGLPGSNSLLGFRVRLPAPTDLAGPDGRVVGTTVPLSWTAPVSRHDVLGYEVLRGDEVVATSIGAAVDVPVSGDGDAFAVRALYDVGTGDLSDEIAVSADVPVLDGLSPADAWRGETLRVTLTGDYLLLVEGDLVASLGAGVTVVDAEVRDVDSAWLTLVVDADAAPGARDLTIATSLYEVTLADAFVIADDDDRPRLTDLEPASIRQGATETFEIAFGGELAGTPTVELGDGFVVQSVEVDGDVVRAVVACATNAPVGEHAVRLDDGVRVFEGVSLTVKDTSPAQPGTCGTPAPAWLAGLGIIASLSRRRTASAALRVGRR
jgi:hypothetical protein